jgi:sigma-E factor negative regulatory protein RseC
MRANKMIEKTAVVISISKGYAWVSSDDIQGCGSCSSNESSQCSSNNLQLYSQTRLERMQVSNPFHAKPGDQVIVGLPSDSLLKSSLLAYLLPLISLIVFSLLGREIFVFMQLNGELGAIFMGFTGLLLGYRFANLLVNNANALKDKLQPVILRKNNSLSEHTIKFAAPIA